MAEEAAAAAAEAEAAAERAAAEERAVAEEALANTAPALNNCRGSRSNRHRRG